jgi:hypothetical protein
MDKIRRERCWTKDGGRMILPLYEFLLVWMKSQKSN